MSNTEPIKAMALCRVSSPEQMQNGSLARQNEAVRLVADKLGVEIPDDYIWSGSVSSKRGTNIERKDLKQMIELSKKDKSIKYLIVDEPDRFMRSIDEAFYFEVTFKMLGVIVYYTDSELNGDNMQAKMMRFMKYFSAEGSNEERINKAINGHRKAIAEGRYPFQIKPGYIKGLISGVQDPDLAIWEYYQKALQDISNETVRVDEAMQTFNKTSPYVLNGTAKPHTLDRWKMIITDPFYAGIVEKDGQINARNEHGLHIKMIEIEQHEKILKIVQGLIKRHNGPKKNGNPKYPLNAVGVCDNCVNKVGLVHRFVGGDHNNGRTPKIYEDYRCRGCGRVIKRDAFHKQAEQQFNNIDLSDRGREELLSALETVWVTEDEELDEERKRIEGRIRATEKAKSEKIKLLSDPSVVSIRADIVADIEEQKVEIEKHAELLSELDNNSAKNKADFMKFALEFADNLGKHFITLSLGNIEVCKQIIFPSGFWVSENLEVYTPQISPVYRLRGIKKELSDTENSNMVAGVGFEPTTSWL